MEILWVLRQITVEPVAFLYMLASFLSYPTLQALIYKKVCLEKYNETFCENLQNKTFQNGHKSEEDYVQSESSYWILKANIAMTVPSCISVLLFLGSWGDKVGRKLPVILPCIGGLITSLCSVINAVYLTASLNYLMIGPTLNGICGGYIANIMSVYSYITHISSTSKTIRIGILESMTFLAGTVGVIISGVMLDNTSFVFVFSFISAVFSLAMLYSILWLENIRPENEVRGDRPACSYWFLDSIKESFFCVMKSRTEKRGLYVILQIIVIVILMIGTSGEMDVLLLYTRRSPLDWSQSMYGYYRGLENFTRSITLLTVLPFLKKKLASKDTSLAIGGLLSKIAGLILLGLATRTWMVFLVVVFGMFQGFPSAGIRSLMSSMVDKHEQGRLFGLLAAAESLASLVASIIFNELYPATLHILPGFCFLLSAGLTFVGLTLVIWIHIDLRGSQQYRSLGEVDDSEGQSSTNTGGEDILPIGQ